MHNIDKPDLILNSRHSIPNYWDSWVVNQLNCENKEY